MESLRVCGWWSVDVDVRISLETGACGGEVKSSAPEGPSKLGDDSAWKCTGSCPCAPRDAGGEASSGFAIRRPPRDWERLKSPSMTPQARCAWLWQCPLLILGYIISNGVIIRQDMREVREDGECQTRLESRCESLSLKAFFAIDVETEVVVVGIDRGRK